MDSSETFVLPSLLQRFFIRKIAKCFSITLINIIIDLLIIVMSFPFLWTIDPIHCTFYWEYNHINIRIFKIYFYSMLSYELFIDITKRITVKLIQFVNHHIDVFYNFLRMDSTR